MQLSMIIAILPVLVNGHMQLVSPFSLNHKENPNTKPGSTDYNYAAPLDGAGTDYPCKKHLSALSGSGGASVATWQAGSTQSFIIGGSAAHLGGSCQASLSEDRGANFRVMKSYIGGCPVPGKPFTFTVPKGTASGPAVFAWTWFNNQGNREMYMNCASVTITGGGSGMGASYPYIFRANIGNGCATVAGTDVVFPNPGKDVENTSANSATPAGACGGAGPEPVGAAVGGAVKPVETAAPAGDNKERKPEVPSKAAMTTNIPLKVTTMNPIVPSEAPKETGMSVVAGSGAGKPGSAAIPMQTPSIRTANNAAARPSFVPASKPKKGTCSCSCDKFSFEISQDEL